MLVSLKSMIEMMLFDLEIEVEKVEKSWVGKKFANENLIDDFEYLSARLKVFLRFVFRAS